jgi:hypothetical protein
MCTAPYTLLRARIARTRAFGVATTVTANLATRLFTYASVIWTARDFAEMLTMKDPVAWMRRVDFASRMEELTICAFGLAFSRTTRHILAASGIADMFAHIFPTGKTDRMLTTGKFLRDWQITSD